MGKFFQSVAVLIITALFSIHTGMAAPVTAPLAPQPGHPLLVKIDGLDLLLGISDVLVRGVVSDHGYNDIRITKRKLTKTRLEACKGGIKYALEVKLDGRLKNKGEIGTCRGVINKKAARRILRRNGYRDIQITPRDGAFVAVACRRDRRFRISMNRFGDIRNEVRTGRCGSLLTKENIADILYQRGFSRITITPGRRDGQYTAKACRGDVRADLLIGRSGAILRDQRIGTCAPPIHPATIPAILARKGFTRIEVIDKKLPRYVARVCEGNQSLEISMNRYGRIVDERKIGRCDPPLTKAALLARLRDTGYDSVRIVEANSGRFVAEVCEDGALFRLRLTIYGETVNQKLLGDCPSLRVKNILRQIEKRGITGASIFIEGCRKKDHIRFELDKYGIIKKRWTIGRCRNADRY